MTEDVSQRAFWDAAYDEKRDGWELGGPSPVLARALSNLHPTGRPRGVVPGCGRGHEVIALAEAGVEAVGLDFAAQAVAGARALIQTREATGTLKAPASVVELDLFAALDAGLGQFDLAVEHTCFCAIDPARRDEYVAVLAGLVRPGGLLLGVFYAHDRPGGPPFTTTEAEVRARLEAAFDVVGVSVPGDSIERRRGHELFIEAVRRS